MCRCFSLTKGTVLFLYFYQVEEPCLLQICQVSFGPCLLFGEHHQLSPKVHCFGLKDHYFRVLCL
ncbi:001R [Invertebrate iridescent virus Kaz2018]|uniref:001R n=1 Tax=Invertebrate iridescent virus 6 TaxID=176652 RepID=Q91G93_IIV6|nr:001R [Invertebrate iridescent virus 6]AAK81939.1 001R [Invertebrate iridescent virus 6]QNH08413.1 001R [Invertebrate iridescent virus Kaz2018]